MNWYLGMVLAWSCLLPNIVCLLKGQLKYSFWAFWCRMVIPSAWFLSGSLFARLGFKKLLTVPISVDTQWKLDDYTWIMVLQFQNEYFPTRFSLLMTLLCCWFLCSCCTYLFCFVYNMNSYGMKTCLQIKGYTLHSEVSMSKIWFIFLVSL